MSLSLNLPFAQHKNIFPEVTIESVLADIEIKFDTFTAKQNGVLVECREPRGTAWFSDSGNTFVYSGKTMHPRAMTPALSAIRYKLETLLGVHYCSVLVNYYPNGKSGMRYHVDPLYDVDDPSKQIWVDDSAVVSVGDSRNFVVREKIDADGEHLDRKYYRFVVESGDVFHMFEGCQKSYQHTIQVEKHEEDAKPRVSLVFKKRLD